MHAIEIDHLTYSYPGAAQPALRDITVNIEQGDFLAIVGNNGCGKSTFCKTLNGLIPQFISGAFEGRVLACGLDTRKSDVGALARKVGYVYQDFENQIIRPTVLDDASYACQNYAMADYRERGRAALAQCGLQGKENDFIWQLSGGQTHLLALAGAVSLQPDVLILDEPIAQLDPAHADCIYAVLRRLNEEYGKTIIVIEHHTEYIADFCKHVMLLKEGRVQWVLPAGEALQRVEELQSCNIFPPQVTIAAWRASRKAGQAERLPTTVEEGKAFFVPKARPEPLPPARRPGQGETVAAFQNVSVAYRSVKGDPHKVFEDLTLDIHKGDKVALIGSNGAGKSTFMKLMVGLLKPSGGSVWLNGRDLHDVRPEALSRQISMVYQNPEDMFIKDSIEKDIAYAMEVRGVPDAAARTRRLLERFRLAGLRERDGRLLSGGQMRRASLAIGVALDPGILLLDEPTANLDIATRKEIMHTLEELKEITETVVIATHDMQLVCEWAERIIVLCGGRVVADGSRDEIFGDRALIEQVGIRPPEIFTMGQAMDPAALCYTIDDFLRRFEGRQPV
ncbi:MAG TPA: ATP-binding cassette domain-containing protein [Candidatus Faecalibacterium gallistercoris]|uniref:ATP-binding cassette domain-containing protein n=1 Tax=Candidatus Faecalibacterium gallistercoris TaxID=2838579 RepID=A0A9D2FG71_9FIRM|nr:ATP-binding cassette domain-containing protein [Candidatus Faecalibacterium gallistercoris]